MPTSSFRWMVTAACKPLLERLGYTRRPSKPGLEPSGFYIEESMLSALIAIH